MLTLLSLADMTVGRVRVIFCLPKKFERINNPLAYIEWSTPLQRYNDTVGMYSIARSQRMRQHRTSIIPVLGIERDSAILEVITLQLAGWKTTTHRCCYYYSKPMICPNPSWDPKLHVFEYKAQAALQATTDSWKIKTRRCCHYRINP